MEPAQSYGFDCNLHGWRASIYFWDSQVKLTELANEHDIEPVLLSSIVITSAEGIKHEDFIKNNIRKSVNFLNVKRCDHAFG